MYVLILFSRFNAFVIEKIVNIEKKMINIILV